MKNNYIADTLYFIYSMMKFQRMILKLVLWAIRRSIVKKDSSTRTFTIRLPSPSSSIALIECTDKQNRRFELNIAGTSYSFPMNKLFTDKETQTILDAALYRCDNNCRRDYRAFVDVFILYQLEKIIKRNIERTVTSTNVTGRVVDIFGSFELGFMLLMGAYAIFALAMMFGAALSYTFYTGVVDEQLSKFDIEYSAEVCPPNKVPDLRIRGGNSIKFICVLPETNKDDGKRETKI